ncbi:MAG: DUF5683 domain-containing protein [Bacteroidales bacterium]
MSVKTFLLIAFIVVLPIVASAQQKDTTIHSPTKATLLSTVLPGLGQAYNERYWKIPVIYAGFAAFAYFIQSNNFRYKLYLDAYSTKYEMQSLDTNLPNYSELYDELQDKLPTQFWNTSITQLQYYKNTYRRDRDLFIIVTAIFYIINIVDATVDAHFFTYDISNDLSLKFQPYVDGVEFASHRRQTNLGLNLSITF